MRTHCVQFSTCSRSDDRAAGGNASMDCSGRDRHAQRHGWFGALVQSVLGERPFSGDVFAFRGKRGDLLKLLWWSGDGMNLYGKRLERGRFVWPQATSGTVHLTNAQLSMLLEGIDWRRPVRTWQPERAA